ncbi:MAG TPA: zinc-binding dehydrogenase [Herpetosiphonaceae bacterium]|nr:zinc-binding dehydrogenase [Herpetosiphonaceae bacterium]
MTTTMPAVVQYGLGGKQVELRELPVPEIGATDVLLQVGAVGVCGSDVHQYNAASSWGVNVPVVMGHEFCGTIAAAGSDVTGFREGDRVVSETAAQICGQCVYCRSGNYNLCPHRLGFGYGTDGAMAGYVRVPQRCLHHIPDNLPFSLASMTEPTCVALNAIVERSSVRPGDSVFVLGPGPIGLLCMLVARLQGASTAVVGGLASDAPRLTLARELGATHTLDLQAEDPAAFVHGLGDGYGVDMVVDASGASATFVTAMELVRPMGQIVKVGWGPAPLGVSLDPIVRKAVRVNGSFSHTYPTWERAIALLASGQLNAAPLAGLHAPLGDWLRGFEGMHDGHIVKAVLYPSGTVG